MDSLSQMWKTSRSLRASALPGDAMTSLSPGAMRVLKQLAAIKDAWDDFDAHYPTLIELVNAELIDSLAYSIGAPVITPAGRALLREKNHDAE